MYLKMGSTITGHFAKNCNVGKVALLLCVVFMVVVSVSSQQPQRQRQRYRQRGFRSNLPAEQRIQTVTDEDQLIRDLGYVLVTNRTAVIRFYADWCPVCRNDQPEFLNLVEKYPESTAKFFKVDVDKHPRLISEYGIRAVPTYFVLRRQTRHLTFHSAREVNNALRRR